MAALVVNVFAAGALCLAGCTSGTSALLATAQHALSSSADPTSPTNPQFSYLRTTVGDRVLYLVLGYIDPTPGGPVEVWYSASGEVIRLRNGRLVGTAGLQTDWRAVRHVDEPMWSMQRADSAPRRFVRERDLMPGYKAGIVDDVEQFQIAAPTDTQMTQHRAGSVQWVEERSRTRPASAALPPARFALMQAQDRVEVVYSEQCLTAELCMSFERWAPPAPADARTSRSAS